MRITNSRELGCRPWTQCILMSREVCWFDMLSAVLSSNFIISGLRCHNISRQPLVTTAGLGCCTALNSTLLFCICICITLHCTVMYYIVGPRFEVNFPSSKILWKPFLAKYPISLLKMAAKNASGFWKTLLLTFLTRPTIQCWSLLVVTN